MIVPKVTQRILAVDPGVATGWAILDEDLAFGIDNDQVLFCDWVNDFSANFSVIVCESFRINASTVKMSAQPASLEIIGFLRWLAYSRAIPFILQEPAEKKFMPDGKLKALGWYQAGPGHDNDALRHLGIYLAKVEKNTEVLSARA